MRGQANRGIADILPEGITPADAGTSFFPDSSVDVTMDHPRGCGDKRDAPAARPPQGGSPPRMRGQGQGTEKAPEIFRITPADAGTS